MGLSLGWGTSWYFGITLFFRFTPRQTQVTFSKSPKQAIKAIIFMLCVLFQRCVLGMEGLRIQVFGFSQISSDVQHTDVTLAQSHI